MKTRQNAGASSFDDAMTELLHDSGISKSSVVRVMGTDGLSSLLWFCRNGYQHVGYIRPNTRATGYCDLLVVGHGGDISGLSALLDNGPSVRHDGLLLIQIPEWVSNEQADDVLDGLARRGFRIDRGVHGHRRELHILCRSNATIEIESTGSAQSAHPSTHN